MHVKTWVFQSMASICFERGEHIVPVVEKWLVNALTFVKYIVRNMAYTWSRNLESKQEKNKFIRFTVNTAERKTTVTLLSVSTATEILQWLTMTLRKSFFFFASNYLPHYIYRVFFNGSIVKNGDLKELNNQPQWWWHLGKTDCHFNVNRSDYCQ